MGSELIHTETSRVCDGEWHNSGGKVYTKGKTEKAYNSWKGMKNRLTGGTYTYTYKYAGKERVKDYSAYNDCDLVEDWLDYKNYEEWFNKQTYRMVNTDIKFEVDKDILFKGNKIYSPETCLIVPGRINRFFVNSGCTVTLRGNKFHTSIRSYVGLNGTGNDNIKAILEYDRQIAISRYYEEKNRILQEDVIPDFIKNVHPDDIEHPMVLRVINALRNYKFNRLRK